MHSFQDEGHRVWVFSQYMQCLSMLLLAPEQQQILEIEEAVRWFSSCAQGQYCTPVWPQIALLWELWPYPLHTPFCSRAAFKLRHVPSVPAWRVLCRVLVWTGADVYIWVGELTSDLPPLWTCWAIRTLLDRADTRPAMLTVFGGTGPWWGFASCIAGFGSLFLLEQAALGAPQQEPW